MDLVMNSTGDRSIWVGELLDMNIPPVRVYETRALEPSFRGAGGFTTRSGK